MARFDRKRVLVLGGNSGIGLAAAQAFAAEGAETRLTGRDRETIAAAVAKIEGATGHVCDIADLDAMDALVAQIHAEDGGIDVLFVNAGIGGFAPLMEITPEYWDQVHSINLRGCVFAVQKCVPLMGRGGAIVLTGSVGAHAALPGNLVYAAAKNGLHAAMKTMALELVGQGIRVNMVSPGPTETPLIHRNPGMDEAAVSQLRDLMTSAVPMGRMGEADEVARAVLFLASEEASFITGANLLVDGVALELR